MNKKIYIPFSKIPLCGNEIKYIKEVLDSGWLTTAKKAAEFEQRFAEYVGAKYACAVNSCTAALHLGIDALGLRMGEKVFVQSMTFTASAEVIRYLRAHPVFLDIEYGTNLITPDILREAIRKNPEVKYLIIVHYGGQSAQLINQDEEGIIDICKRHGIKVLHDAAHALPSRLAGRMIGTFDDATCFSFYANKTITTGEGGMLVTNVEEVYKRAKIMRLHGINRDIWDRYTMDTPSWEYDVVDAGFKYNMPDINAAIGLAQLEKAEDFHFERLRVAEFYLNKLKDLNSIDLPVVRVPMKDHSWHLFPIILNENARISRNDFIDKLFSLGIGTSVHYKPLHRMTYYRNRYDLSASDFPNTEKTWSGIVSLPIYPFMKKEELEYICKSIKEILNDETTPSYRQIYGPNIKINTLQVKPEIWLSSPHMGGSEYKYVQNAFETNWVAPVGSNIDEFESSLARYCNVKHAAVLSSGTAAIHLSLIVLGVEKGDEVLSSTFTFSATVNPIVYQGAIPVLIDSEKDTWNMDPEILEFAIKNRLSKGKKPKAIIVVHLYGMPAKMTEIMNISQKYEIPIIEDAAEALGSRYAGNPIGSFGKASILSFNGNKIITTSGGGAILSNQEDLIKKARFLATQARDNAPHYQHSQIGYNYRMSNVLAGIGLGQMEVLNERVKKRRDNYNFYKTSLSECEGISFQAEPDESYFSNHWLTAIIVDPKKTGTDRKTLQNKLTNDFIESRPLWKPMHMQPIFSACPAYLNGVSENLFTMGLCLPSGSNMSDSERLKVMNVIRKSLNEK
jgi:dTDP-4-amino-4,6-dideoxygalactose transaminase